MSGIKVYKNHTIAPYTWFQTGGPADVFFKPNSIEDLSFFLKDFGDQITLIGAGSNILVRDYGISGAVIKLGRNFRVIKFLSSRVILGAACLNRTVVEFCSKHGLSGLEFLIGIPGTVGGAVAMNAGAHGSETKDFLVEITVMDRKGSAYVVSKKDLEMGYRFCILPQGAVILSATFDLIPSNQELIENKIKKCLEHRNQSQPIKGRTGGSTFKNPPGEYAWKLIDAVGLRGHKIGDAQFSEKHCNFILNTNKANACDIENLGELARQKIKGKFGIDLEWEIKRVGRR